MSSVELSNLEKKSLESSSIFWTQRVLNHATKIIEGCETDDEIDDFFGECETKIRDPTNHCRITWNIEIQRFGGDEFNYVLYFHSDIIKLPIKVSIKLIPLDQTIAVGNMEIANRRDKRKLDKHLNTREDSISGSDENT